MSNQRVAIVGATGAVGTTMLEILTSRGLPVSELRLMASSRSAGRVVPTKWGDVTVEDLATADPSGVDIALFSAGGGRSKEYAPKFAAAGAVVVDNSSAFRMDDSVPLVVAGVNDHAVADHQGIVANPNCTTMTVMMAAGPLHRAAGIEQMTATSYQSHRRRRRSGEAPPEQHSPQSKPIQPPPATCRTAWSRPSSRR